ncbi:serine/threonine-protein kinase [Nonomuraea ferruginea]|uniref:non-specific serine/threonine protein kinase n=1 Tax=Nonomuraea ferruginea TaxID=46174 RepID=A0ABT4T7F5_9ACTN|nr:serine/threonine-protein kinase [Nonomuraea ferruginea]MDA0645427.1 protein kinase [Nonomuraea ferruginea]
MDRQVGNRYRLVEPLGEGGMGVVWRAYDELLDRTVAIKEVRYSGVGERQRAELNRRTIREARAAGRLDHPSVVVIHDVVEEDGRPWIVMQLVRSRSLAEAIRADGPLPVARAAAIGARVLDALRAAHATGVLHRDVKPENVLLADDGRVVLTDFGIATMESEAGLTATGSLVGTPAYMPPERLNGEPARPESDLWSLGATLYAAVEGGPPFRRDSWAATVAAVLRDAVEPPRRAGALTPVIMGWLQRDPGTRLPAGQAAQLLDAASMDRPFPGHGHQPPSPYGAFHQQPAPLTPDNRYASPPADPAPHAPAAQHGAGPAPHHASTPYGTSGPHDVGSGPHHAGASGPHGAGPAPHHAGVPHGHSGPGGGGPALLDSHGGSGSYGTPPQGTGPQRSPHGTVTGGGRSGGKRWVVVAAAVAALVVVGGGGVVLVNLLGSEPGIGAVGPTESTHGPSGEPPRQPTREPGGDPTAGGTGEPTGEPTGNASGEPTGNTTGEPTGNATGEPTGNATGEPTGNPVPAGWRAYRNAAGGFSVAVPRGWRAVKNPQRDSVTFSGPGTPGVMIVEWTVPEGDHATPADHWRALEREILRKGEFPGYERVAIRAIEYQGRPAADWEFTRSRDGTAIHVINRGFTTAGGRPFALYWETTGARWERDRRFFETFTATFRPAR